MPKSVILSDLTTMEMFPFILGLGIAGVELVIWFKRNEEISIIY